MYKILNNKTIMNMYVLNNAYKKMYLGNINNN